MNSDLQFKTLEELYNRIKPALYSKTIELKKCGCEYIKEEDIWNYLIKNTWTSKVNLSLSEMISDILNVDNSCIVSFVMKTLEQTKREANMEDGNLL